ncbi:MAG: hypothetical protein V1728_01620 [Candidatus Micrarchaeota archaeon]
MRIHIKDNIVLSLGWSSMEKKFYLQSADKPLQEIGLRAQVVSFLMAQGVKEGNVLNDEEDEKKVIVAIRTDDKDDTKINDLRDMLVKHLNGLNKNDLCYSNFPNNLIASELHDLNNPHVVGVLNMSDLATSLMLEQTSKGAGAMINTFGKMTTIATAMTAMATAMTTMATTMEKLPERIAVKLGEVINKQS